MKLVRYGRTIFDRDRIVSALFGAVAHGTRPGVAPAAGGATTFATVNLDGGSSIALNGAEASALERDLFGEVPDLAASAPTTAPAAAAAPPPPSKETTGNESR